MGLLDDAIKEHLELKRRHGADPGEVARLEHEALGPARRDPAPAAVEEPVAAEQRARAGRGRRSLPRRRGRARRGDRRGAPRGSDPSHRARAEPEPGAGAGRHARPRRPRRSPRVEVEQPTRQFSLEEVEAATAGPEAPAEPAPPAEAEAPPAEDVVPADDEPDSEDVLEETPEFLQETPEHDRLWFEQKPPRDFDF